MNDLLKGNKTFISRQLAPVTLLALISSMSDYAASIISTVIVGGSFGEMGLVIVGITAPIETFKLFICDFLCGSSVYLRNVAISEGKDDKGNRMVGNASIICFIIGAVIFFLMRFGAEFYLSFFNLSEETLAYAIPYVKAMAVGPLLGFFEYFFYEFVFRLGAKFQASCMIVTCSAGILAMGIIFINIFGIVGMAYANVLSDALNIIIGGVTILAHRKEISFKLGFKKDELIELVRYGFSYSQDTFYYPVYSAAINMFMGRNLGESAIAVFAVIECVSEICSLFYGVSYAAENHLSYYVGENNIPCIKKTLSASLRLQFIISVIVTILVFVFAQPIAVFMGMEEAYAAETIFALRVYALSFVFLALVCYNSDFYCANEQTAACVSLYFSKTIIAGTVITIILGTIWGSTGIYIGKALESPLALLITYFVTRKVYKSKSIYILPEDDGTIETFDYDINENEVIRVRSELEELLDSKGVTKETKLRILLAFEECNMLTLDNNTKPVYGECSVFFKDDCIEMILRDSGKLFDITDTDSKLSSLRGYIVASMVMHYRNARHINASNTNRVQFSFPTK